MISIVLGVLAILVVLLGIVVALQPSDFRVARSITVAASPSAAFTQVNDLEKWQQISPYVKLDPMATSTFDGPPVGMGASLSWIGNSQIGEGRMTIVESRPNERVRMKLEFVRPFASTCLAEFTFKPDGSQTVVTWSMAGPRNFLSKAVGLVMNLDKMIGSQFEEGLANLKARVEPETTSVRLDRAHADEVP